MYRRGPGVGCWRWLLLAAVLGGCVENPVTGERELGFVSTAQQIAIGEQQYVPAQQMQGGQYVVDPELSRYVQRVGERVAAHSGIDLPYEFVVLNNSVPNAWALPGGKLAINRGLLTELSNEAELAAVLGHEITHAAARHGAKAIERGVLAQAALLGVMIGVADTDYANAAIGAAQLAAGLLNQKYGRNAEREADYYGTRMMAKAGYDPYAAVTLQEKFVRLSEGREPSWLEGLFASHPPSTERVANNRELVDELRAEGFTGGEFNADAYQAALRPLRRDAEAYAAYDKARKALAEGKVGEAEALVSRALEMQPAEPAFHGLRGEIRLRQERYDDARINFERALERDDAFYAYHLGRGIALARQGDAQAARQSLQHSLELLPTAVAYHELGVLAERAGDLDAALSHYETAAQSESPAGQAARAKLLRLDLPRNPSRYVDAALARDAGGRLVMQVSNRTGAALADVDVLIETLDAAGQRRRFGRRLDYLAPGTASVMLVAEGAGDLVDARASVVSARLAERLTE
ncbi:MAG TPA: M48 family metalloprotease [Pseudomonadales bacterium]